MRRYAICGSVLVLSACATAEVAAQPRAQAEGGSMQGESEVLLATTEDGAAPIQLPAQGLTLSLRVTSALHVLAGDPALRLYLVFEGATADPPPGVGYNVWLGDTAREPADVNSPGYAGTLTFYHSFASKEQRGGGQRSIALTVTRVVLSLLAAGELSRALTVTVIPARPPIQGAKPQIRRVKLVWKRS